MKIRQEIRDMCTIIMLVGLSVEVLGAVLGYAVPLLIGLCVAAVGGVGLGLIVAVEELFND